MYLDDIASNPDQWSIESFTMTHAVLSEWCAHKWSPKSLADSNCVATHAIPLLDPFNAAHPLIIPLLLSCVTSYFDVYSLNIAEHKNKDILKMHLTAEELPWDQSTEEYSEHETHIMDH